MTKWLKIVIIVSLAILFMWIPMTRSLILFILPLGSGIDDLIFFILLGCLGVLLFFRLEKFGNWIRKTFLKETDE